MEKTLQLLVSDHNLQAALEKALTPYFEDGRLSVVDDSEAGGPEVKIIQENTGLELKNFAIPVRFGRLLDCINTALNQLDGINTDQTVCIGGVYEMEGMFLRVMDNESADDAAITLTEKEQMILRLLSQGAGQEIARKTLLEKVWGYSQEIDTHTLETHIYRLRQKIERDPSKPEILVTTDQGYAIKSI